MPERVIFLVDMDAFFASCEQALDPRLRGRPIIVCGNPKTRSVVAACSYEAKSYGIENGMSVSMALARCPHAKLVPGQPDLYIDLARRIFSGLERYTPLVEVVSIDEAFLDVTGTWERWFQSPEEAACRIQQEIQAGYDLSCTVGIGPNKLLAKLCAGGAKPHGIGRIRPQDLPKVLESLPVQSVNGIGPRWTDALAEMGIRTLGALAREPVDALASPFGVCGVMFHRMALGVDESSVLAADCPDVPKSMGHAYTLERDTTDSDQVEGMLLKLSEKVARRLRADGFSCRTVSATVRFQNFTTVHRQRTGPEPLSDGLAIYGVAQRLLNEIWGKHRKPGGSGAASLSHGAMVVQLPGAAAMSRSRQPVRLVGVGVSSLTRTALQPDLWGISARNQRLIHSLDRINDTFGEETIARAGAKVPFIRKTRGYFDRRWQRNGHLI